MPYGSSSPADLSTHRLDSLRLKGDPLADAVIEEAFAANGVNALNALMRSFVANEHPVPADLHPALRNYLERGVELPPWARADLISTGENVFWRFGPRVVLALFCFSLPFTYLGRDGVPVLVMTNRLSSNPTRRIVETAQMVVDVMNAGGLTDPNGRGRLTIQKVRLMHAAIRHLAPLAPSWKISNGVPVNQEDMTGTLMAFSWVTLEGLRKMDVALTESDCEAYLHCWSVAGHLLGVQDDLLPVNMQEAEALAGAIAAHQFGPTPEGQALTKSLVDMLAHIVPGNVFDRAPALFIRYFLGEKWAGWLGVQNSILADFVAAPLRLTGIKFSGIVEDSKALSMIAERLGHLLIDAIVCVERGGNRPTFTVPTELRQQWGQNWRS